MNELKDSTLVKRIQEFLKWVAETDGEIFVLARSFVIAWSHRAGGGVHGMGLLPVQNTSCCRVSYRPSRHLRAE